MSFVTNYPAMKLGDCLVIADLHLGITRDLYERGVRMPSQVQNLADKLHKLKRLSKTKRLVIAGDFKHKVPGISMQELREIPDFLFGLKFEKVIIVKGNHDGNIEKIIPEHLKGKVVVKKSFRINNAVVTHGHRNIITKAKTVIIGHNHPHIMFIDAVGARYIEPCWIKGRYGKKSVIIIPAFNPLSGAIIVNREPFHGPIAVKITNAKAYLLDGTDLGNLKDLKIKQGR